MWLAAYSIIAASIIAMYQDNLKKRLAYSTISQLSYITLGMALASSMGALGGGMHIAMHAMGKITLFMCAGAIYVKFHKTEISQMTGLGRAMPITLPHFYCFAFYYRPATIGWLLAKILLMLGAVDTGHYIIIGVLMLSSLLNVAYLLPIVGRAFFCQFLMIFPERIMKRQSSAGYLQHLLLLDVLSYSFTRVPYKIFNPNCSKIGGYVNG